MTVWQQTRRLWPHVRHGLDLAAVALTIAASLAVLWMLASTYVGRGSTASKEPPSPSQPVPLDGAVLKGNKNARVGVVLYTDFQCPFCRSFARDTLPLIVREYVDRGDVLLAVRQFPIRRLHDRSVAAAVAARCAEDRGRFWEMHDQLFLSQLPLDEPGLISRAKTIGLDPTQFTGCLQGSAAVANVNQDVALATANSVRGTPTIHIGLIDKRNRLVVTRTLVGVKDMSTIRLVLAKTLAQRR